MNVGWVGYDENVADRVDEMIQAATSDDCIAEDWATFVDIADRVKAFKDPEQGFHGNTGGILSRNHVGRLREVLRCLRKRLQSRHPRAVYLALTLTESLAKNCGVPLLQAMDVDDKFLPQMGKVAKDLHKKTDRNATEAYRKCLDLIQAWGEEFLPIQEQYGLRNFVRLYHNLRVQGYRFSAPQLDESRPPIFTPPPSASAGGERRSSGQEQQPSSSAASAGGQQQELPGELGVVQNMVNMCSEIMQAAESQGDILRNDVLRDMLSTLKNSERIVQQSLEDLMTTKPQLVEPALQLNDDAHQLLQFYNKVKREGLPPPGERHLPGRTHATEHAPIEEAGEGEGGGGGNDQPAEEDLLGDLLGDKPPAPAATVVSKTSSKQQSPAARPSPGGNGRVSDGGSRRRSASSRSGSGTISPPKGPRTPTQQPHHSSNSSIPSIRPPPGSNGGRSRASSGRRLPGTQDAAKPPASQPTAATQGQEPEDDFFAAIDSAKGDSALPDDPFVEEDDPFAADTSATDPFDPQAASKAPTGRADAADDAWWLETNESQGDAAPRAAARPSFPPQQPQREQGPPQEERDPFDELMGSGGQTHAPGANSAGSNPFDAVTMPSGAQQQAQHPSSGSKRPSASQNPFDMF